MERVKVNYAEVDFGTKSASPIKTEVIEVKVSTDRLVTNYAHAVVMKMITDSPRVYQQYPVTEDELIKYLGYLLYKRCEQCGEGCKDWGRLKALYILSYWQFILSMIGQLVKRSYAIQVIPVYDGDCPLTYEQAKEISDRIGMYEDILFMDRAAMPTGIEGDEAVMSSALIADTVVSMNDKMHPAFSYVVAMANMKLKQEASFSALYRAQYDDIETIALQMSYNRLV